MALLGVATVTVPALAQPGSVLVVYNLGVTDSLTLANYYAGKRGIPLTNLCGISVSDPSAISYNEYVTQSPLPSTLPVKTQIRNCLTAVTTPVNPILYIVMAYQTPYDLSINNTTYALDSFVADIWDRYTTQIFSPTTGPTSATQGYYADAESQGDAYMPFVPLATWRAQGHSTLIYSVWRLDGATLALAEGLVDKAISAEQNGLTGQACFDLHSGGNPDTSGTLDLGIEEGDWDLHRAAGFLSGAGFTLSEYFNQEFEPPTPSQQCNGAAFYSGWYALNAYPANTFTWNTGAIGYHLDSLSAQNPRGGTNWAANAIMAGITVTSGSVNEPFLQGLPRPGGLFRNLLQGASVGDAFLRNTRWLKWMILYLGDPLYKPFPGGHNPPAPALSFAVSPREGVPGGYQNAIGTVTLPSAAGAGGEVVTLSNPSPQVASTPATVTVPANTTQASFTITTYPSGGFVTVITAIDGALQVSNTVSTAPMLAGPALAQTSVTGGQSVLGAVFLNGRAPIGGLVVNLSSSNTSAAAVPATVTVPAGQESLNFTVTTSPVTSSTLVTITASQGLVTPTVNLTVNP
jgi:uncharacterized protein (TIGR03790 family)